MACATTRNRTEPCKEFVGGLRGIYLIPYAYDNVVTFDGSNLVSLITTSADLVTPITAYFWELKGLSTLEGTDIVDVNNGVTAHEYTLTLSFKPSGNADTDGEMDNDDIQNILQGRWQIIVWDRNDQFRLLGEELGCDANGGTHSWGAELGDARLNTITLVSREKTPPALVAGSSPSDIEGTVITKAA